MTNIIICVNITSNFKGGIFYGTSQRLFLDFDSLIQKELSELAREYGLHNKVLRKVGTFFFINQIQ